MTFSFWQRVSTSANRLRSRQAARRHRAVRFHAAHAEHPGPLLHAQEHRHGTSHSIRSEFYRVFLSKFFVPTAGAELSESFHETALNKMSLSFPISLRGGGYCNVDASFFFFDKGPVWPTVFLFRLAHVRVDPILMVPTMHFARPTPAQTRRDARHKMVRPTIDSLARFHVVLLFFSSIFGVSNCSEVLIGSIANGDVIFGQ